MNNKNKFLLLFILYLCGNICYSDAYLSPGKLRNGNSIQYSRTNSNIIYNSINGNKINIDQTTYRIGITEIKNKIAKNPDNYPLYINLADANLQNEDFVNARDTLISLADRINNGIDEKTRKEALNLLGDLKIERKNDQNRSYYYANMSLLSLIAGNTAQAESYLNTSLSGIYSADYVKPVLIRVIKNTANYKFAADACGKILEKNENDTEIRKLKADYLLKAGDKEAAAGEYSRIVALNPSDKESLYQLYKQVALETDSDKIILSKIYKITKPEKRDYQRMYSDLSEILLKHNENRAALKYAELLVAKFPENADGYITLSEIYRREGDIKAAEEILEKARVKADNNEQISKYNVVLAKMSDQPLMEAHSLMNAGLYKQALEVLESADQSNLYVIISEAKAAYFSDYKQKALDYLNKATVLFPENADVYSAFAYIYLYEKDIESAKKYINKSLKIAPDNKTSLSVKDAINKAEADSYKKLIISSIDAQNYDKAAEIVDKALMIDSKNAGLYYYKALTLISKNNYKQAVENLKKCIEYDKNYTMAYYSLGMAYDNLSDKTNALTNYTKFLQSVSPDDFEAAEKKEYAKSRIAKLSK